MNAKPVTRALIVGINRYQDPANNLRGCVNDALTMAKIVTEHAGFPRDGVRLLCDDRATTANIRQRLCWLLEGAGRGSRLLFHYSGHGSQVRDRNGDELDDHLDEIICPHDLDWDDPMTDDEFGALIADAAPDVGFTMILDCCHSGTGSREFCKELPTESQRQRARFLPPPPDVAWRAAGEVDIDAANAGRTVNLKKRRARLERFGLAITKQNVVLIAGCRADQTSADAFIDNDYRGALTYSLYKALQEAKYQATSREVVRRASEWLSHNGYEQIPQLEGRADLIDGAFLGGASDADGSVAVSGAGGATVSSWSVAVDRDGLHPVEASKGRESDGSGAAVAGGIDFAPGALSSVHVVFVHGIGDHRAGYSNAWRQVFSPFLDVPAANYHEVVWADVFEDLRTPGPRGLRQEPGGLTLKELAEAADYEQQIRELLAAREDVLVMASGSGATAAGAGSGRRAQRTCEPASGAEPRLVEDAAERALFNWLVYFGRYIADFAKYLASASVRRRVDEKLQLVLEPLFAANAPVILITHSWGTVVGLHTLRRLQGHGQAALHCTLGSPLWLLPVRRALGLTGDRFSREWLNIDAAGDLVGGRLHGLFDVTAEAVNVDAPGKSPHGSYFLPGNVRVQRDLVAAYVKEAVTMATV